MDTRPDPRDGYSSVFFEQLVRVEDRHFWFRFRNRVLSELVKGLAAKFTNGYRVLEAGCGDGNVLRFLERVCSGGAVVGIDLFMEGLQLAKCRSSSLLVQGDVHTSPFNCEFDIIGIFDVLEHLADDQMALRDLHQLLSTRGVLLITVPAHMSLWSYFDECGHYRRYSVPDLSEKLHQCGYDIDYITEYMFILYPLLWLGRRISAIFRRNRVAQRGTAAPDLTVVPVLNDVLLLLLCVELPLLRRRIRLPMGSSLLAIAHRRPVPLQKLPAEAS